MLLNESELKFTSNAITLVGSFMAAEDEKAIALIITGSGRVNRDSNHERIKLNVSNSLALSLSKQNISSFRYDKRGIGESSGDYWSATLSDNIDDAHAAVSALRQKNPDKKIFIIGHSEGALIAANVAATRNDLSGIVLLAGSIKKGRDVLSWQLDQVLSNLQGVSKWLLKILPINPVKSHQKLLNKIQNSNKNIIRIMGVKKINAGWLRQFMNYDPVKDFANINCPVLAITGKKDIQVPVNDLLDMKKIIPTIFEGHAIDDLTHLLRNDKEQPSLSHYKNLIKLPMDADVLSIINAWLNSLSK